MLTAKLKNIGVISREMTAIIWISELFIEILMKYRKNFVSGIYSDIFEEILRGLLLLTWQLTSCLLIFNRMIDWNKTLLNKKFTTWGDLEKLN